METGKNSGCIRGVVVHTGSRSGYDPKYKFHAKELARLLAEAGYIDIYYGDGHAGNMGAFARSAIKHGARVQGITLDFFTAAQGHNLDGAKPSIIVPDMHARMEAMRADTQAAIVLPGSVGTMEEALEWVCSRNHVVKPQILVNIDGYWDGFKQFLTACKENGFRDPDDIKRTYIVDTPEEAVEKLNELSSMTPIPEVTHTVPAGEWDEYVEETKHALIVHPASLNVMSELLTRLVAYDVSNIPGQTLFTDDVIKPVIFVNKDGHYDGMQKQFKTCIEEGFIPEERKAFFYFEDSYERAKDIADMLDAAPPLLPAHLDARHAEAMTHIVQDVEGYVREHPSHAEHTPL